jgi:hypothetical protein
LPPHTQLGERGLAPRQTVAVAIAEFPARFQEIARAIDWVCRNFGAATEIGRAKDEAAVISDIL